MLTMFFYHEMRDLSREEELQVLRSRVRNRALLLKPYQLQLSVI